MGGEMKLRGVERATAEAVDMIPPPHLTTRISAINSTQLSAGKAGQGTSNSVGRETRAGGGGFTNRP